MTTPPEPSSRTAAVPPRTAPFPDEPYAALSAHDGRTLLYPRSLLSPTDPSLPIRLGRAPAPVRPHLKKARNAPPNALSCTQIFPLSSSPKCRLPSPSPRSSQQKIGGGWPKSPGGPPNTAPAHEIWWLPRPESRHFHDLSPETRLTPSVAAKNRGGVAVACLPSSPIYTFLHRDLHRFTHPFTQIYTQFTHDLHT